MLCRKKLSATQRRIRRCIAVVLAVCILLVAYIEFAVKAQLRDIIIQEMHTVSQTAVNMAVSDFLAEHADVGERLTALRYSEGGAVAAIATDPSYINFVKSEITSSSQRYIDAISHDKGIAAHLGSFSGLVLFNNFGPTVSFEVSSVQTVSCAFTSTFEDGGINQTVHHITLDVSVDVLVYNPFKIRQKIHTSTSYEIGQTVIVGSVPTYGGVLTY